MAINVGGGGYGSFACDVPRNVHTQCGIIGCMWYLCIGVCMYTTGVRYVTYVHILYSRDFLGVAGACTTAPKLRLKQIWMLPKSTPPWRIPLSTGTSHIHSPNEQSTVHSQGSFGRVVPTMSHKKDTFAPRIRRHR